VIVFGVEFRIEQRAMAPPSITVPRPPHSVQKMDIERNGEDTTERDPSKIRFWKEDGEPSLRLQIMLMVLMGSIQCVFCGPGGCGDPDSEGRITFITKGRNYEVISESGN